MMAGMGVANKLLKKEKKNNLDSYKNKANGVPEKQRLSFSYTVQLEDFFSFPPIPVGIKTEWMD